MADIIARHTRNVTFHFYQLIHGDGEFRDRDLIKAAGVIQHVTDEIDVINLSAGLDHAGDPDRDCTADSAECLASEKFENAVADEVLVVTAAGDELQTNDMCCPGTMERIIAAAGVIPRCTANPNDSPSNVTGLYGRDQQGRPPNAFWIATDHENHEDAVYCTNRGCAPGMNCLDNREYQPWEHNHSFGSNTPDILAPVLMPYKTEDDTPFLLSGSSYAPPFITSQVANLLASLSEVNHNPNPETVHRGLKEAQKEIPDSDIGMLSGYELGNWFGQRYGLEFTVGEDDGSDTFFTLVEQPTDFE